METVCPGAQAPDFDDRARADFPLGGLWGGYEKIAWFRPCVPIPKEWREEKTVLRFLVGPRDGYSSTAETQLYVNGVPLQAIDVCHEEAWLPSEYTQLDEIVVALRAWNGIYLTPPQRRFNEASLIRIDEPTQRFYYLTNRLTASIAFASIRMVRSHLCSINSIGVKCSVLPAMLQMFEDRSIVGEAWEVDIFYQDKMRALDDLIEAVVEEMRPLRGVLRLTWRFANTTIFQRLTIYRNSARIDFRTQLDWHEHQVLLKAAFPVHVRAIRATYEIQFGSIERPTHWNTSFDTAHYENAAHKWVDLSEGNYGVAFSPTACCRTLLPGGRAMSSRRPMLSMTH